MMAASVRDMHHATWGLYESGAAGPLGSPYGDAVGEVCMASDALHSRTQATGLSERALNMDLFARDLLRSRSPSG